MADRTKFNVGANRQVDDDQLVPDNMTVTGGLFMGAQQVELVTGAKTLDEGDSGVIQRVTATATVTLPATVVGYVYIIENGGADGTITITVAPAAADKLMGNGFTSADNKAAVCTLGNKGDRITLHGDGVNGYMFADVVGTWTRAA